MIWGQLYFSCNICYAAYAASFSIWAGEGIFWHVGSSLRQLWVQGLETLVPADLEVALVPYEKGGLFPGLFLFTGPGRMIRPVVQLPGGSSELIGTLEQINLHIRLLLLPDALCVVL